jgi:hypothetical protein
MDVRIKSIMTGANMGNTTKKSNEHRTTVGIKRTTKDKLDKNRAPGQCYDGFLCQMVDLWEKSSASKKY